MFCALFALNTFAGRDVDAPNPDDSTSTTIPEIDWMTMEEAMEAIKTEPKLIFIDFYTDWCGWCKRMDGTTFKDSLIVKEISQNYYAVNLIRSKKKILPYKIVPINLSSQGEEDIMSWPRS